MKSFVISVLLSLKIGVRYLRRYYKRLSVKEREMVVAWFGVYTVWMIYAMAFEWSLYYYSWKGLPFEDRVTILVYMAVLGVFTGNWLSYVGWTRMLTAYGKALMLDYIMKSLFVLWVTTTLYFAIFKW